MERHPRPLDCQPRAMVGGRVSSSISLPSVPFCVDHQASGYLCPLRFGCVASVVIEYNLPQHPTPKPPTLIADTAAESLQVGAPLFILPLLIHQGELGRWGENAVCFFSHVVKRDRKSVRAVP